MADAPPSDPNEALRAKAGEVFQRYVRQYLNGRLPNCPACGPGAPGATGPILTAPQPTQWTFAGPVAFVGVYEDPSGGLGMTTHTTPMALLVCTKCFYTMQFAWMPIKAKMGV
jgi:hypothetical protein